MDDLSHEVPEDYGCGHGDGGDKEERNVLEQVNDGRGPGLGHGLVLGPGQLHGLRRRGLGEGEVLGGDEGEVVSPRNWTVML